MRSYPTRTAPLRGRLRLERLEDRQLLSGYQPTPTEQVFLERLNDARANPAAYGASIGVDLSYVSPEPPLAMDPRLVQSARDHSQDMNDVGYFGHTGSDGSSPGERMSAAGFPWWGYAESIAGGYAVPEETLAALITDSGVPDLGHRNQLLGIGSPYSDLQEVGVGYVHGGGPFHDYYTIDSGYTADRRPFLTGVVYNDLNGNGRYDAGEGLGGVTITVSGVGSTTSFDSGGYNLQLNPGTYTVTASGGGLSAPVTQTVTVGAASYRLNILPGSGSGAPNSPPVLDAIPNQTIPAGTSLVYTLSASDPDGDPLTFSATAASQEYTLRQSLGLTSDGNYYFNWGGRNEEWVQSAGGQWYFILPDGEFYQWDGSGPATGTLVATLSTADYADPSRLWNATPGATVSFAGNQLTVTPDAGFTGQLTVNVTVSDGLFTVNQAFTLTVS